MGLYVISFFGATNSGKSSLVNAIAGQEVSLVSPTPGTTTDPVRKRIELPGLGPCVLIDTAGLEDSSLLGPERARLTRRILDETDIAVVLTAADGPEVRVPVQGMDPCEQKGGQTALTGPMNGPLQALYDMPMVRVMTKADLGGTVPPGMLPVSALTGEGIPELLQRLAEVAPKEQEGFLTGDLVKSGDNVLLVMPQDSEAPKGRLILPQVQVLRELLDRGCVPHCCTPATLKTALESLGKRPDLVITDSQVFALVERTIPADCPLTSFSILLAAAKGDIRTFVEGAKAIDTLKPGDRVLIAEACTHVPDTEDIGRVKIPALLRAKLLHSPESDKSFSTFFREKNFSSAEVEEVLRIDIAAGNDFPEDLSPYALIVHCGGCVVNARLIRNRTRKALLAGVPITNYGIAIAKLQGILERVEIPSLRSE